MEEFPDDPLQGFSIDDDDDDEDVETVLDPLHHRSTGTAESAPANPPPPSTGTPSSSRSAAAAVSASVSANAAALMSSLNSSLSEEKWSAAAPPAPAAAAPAASVVSAASLLKGNEERIVAEHLQGATFPVPGTFTNTTSVGGAPTATRTHATSSATAAGAGHPLMAESAPSAVGQLGQVQMAAAIMSSGPPVTTNAPVQAAAVGVVGNGTVPAQLGGAGPSHLKVRAHKSASAWYENVGSLARKTANTLSDAAVQAGTVVAHAAAQADVAVSQLDQRVGGHQGVHGGGVAAAATAVDKSKAATQQHQLQHQQQAQSLLPSQMSQPGQPGQPTAHELDNAKKSAVLSSALAESLDSLLPGERVIMFLSHLSNVRDSAGTNTGINTDYDLLYDNTLPSMFENGPGPTDRHAGDGVIWCCAMTFYRVILFTYRECDFPDDEKAVVVGEESKLESSSSKEGAMTDIKQDRGDSDNDKRCGAVLDELIRTASVSRQYQLVQGKGHCGRGKTKRHHILQMPLASIERVERVSHYAGAMTNGSQFTTSGTSLGLILYGKDNFRYLRFTAPSYNDAVRAHEALNTYAFPGRRNLGYLFAFESRRTEVMASIRKVVEPEDGSNVSGTAQQQQRQQQMITARSTSRRYEALKEFERLGILRPRDINTLGEIQQDRQDGLSNGPQLSPWKTILTANSSYTLCPSYPSVLVGPRHISDDDAEGQRILRRVAAFRSEGRMPVLTWGNSVDGASIWRSSQPRVGLQGNRSSADEHYLRAIADCASNSALPPEKARRLFKIPSTQFLRMLIGGTNEEDLLLLSLASINAGNGTSSPPFGLKIMDLRPKSSAVANRTQGMWLSS